MAVNVGEEREQPEDCPRERMKTNGWKSQKTREPKSKEDISN